MTFDEFNLDLVLYYEGSPIDAMDVYEKPQIMEEAISTIGLSLCLIRRDVDRIDVDEKKRPATDSTAL